MRKTILFGSLVVVFSSMLLISSIPVVGYHQVIEMQKSKFEEYLDEKLPDKIDGSIIDRSVGKNEASGGYLLAYLDVTFHCKPHGYFGSPLIARPLFLAGISEHISILGFGAPLIYEEDYYLMSFAFFSLFFIGTATNCCGSGGPRITGIGILCGFDAMDI